MGENGQLFDNFRGLFCLRLLGFCNFAKKRPKQKAPPLTIFGRSSGARTGEIGLPGGTRRNGSRSGPGGPGALKAVSQVWRPIILRRRKLFSRGSCLFREKSLSPKQVYMLIHDQIQNFRRERSAENHWIKTGPAEIIPPKLNPRQPCPHRPRARGVPPSSARH